MRFHAAYLKKNTNTFNVDLCLDSSVSSRFEGSETFCCGGNKPMLNEGLTKCGWREIITTTAHWRKRSTTNECQSSFNDKSIPC